MSGFKWEFFQKKKWHRFDPKAEEAVEEALQKKKKSAKSTFLNPVTNTTHIYEYDLDKYVQTNTDTGTERRIRREPDNSPPAPVRASKSQRRSRHGQSAGAQMPSLNETISYKGELSSASSHAFRNVTSYEEATAEEIEALAEDDVCGVCRCGFEVSPNPEEVVIRMSKCEKHLFHLGCVNRKELFKDGCVRCPICMVHYGVKTGIQPAGKMAISEHSHMKCDGYDCGTIQISYSFHQGTQREGMPNPSTPYSGTDRICYLPNNEEGRGLLDLLKTAFRRGLLFVVGTSVTTGQENTVVWGAVHHKTRLNGGSSHHGWPDPDFFDRCKDELKGVGVEPE